MATALALTVVYAPLVGFAIAMGVLAWSAVKLYRNER